MTVDLDRVFWRFADFLGLGDLGERDGLGEGLGDGLGDGRGEGLGDGLGEAMFDDSKDAKSLLSSLNC